MLEYKINVANAAPTISVSGLSFSASGTGTCSYTGGTYLDAGFTQNWNTVNSPVTVDCNWSGSFSSSNFTAGQTYYVKIVFTDSSGSVTGTSSYTQPAAATTTTTTAATTTTTAATTTTTATTTTSAANTTTTAAGSSSPTFTGVSFELLQLSENQFQVRPYIAVSRMPISTPGGLVQTWTVTRGGSAVASGTYTSGSTALNSPNPFPMEVVSASNLSANTTYVVTMNAGISGNMVSGSRSITTNGSGWGTTTTSTINSGSSTSTSVSGGTTTTSVSGGTTTTTTTVFYNDPAPYMARINSSNVVIDVCVCSESFVRSNPSRYPGTWVPMWMGVNGKNYAGPGWIYDPVAENFYPPTTTTTSTTPSASSTTTASGSSITIEPTTTSSGSSITIEPTTTSSLTKDSSAPSSGGASNNSADSTSSTTTAVPNGEARVTIGGIEVKSSTAVEGNTVTVSVGDVKAEVSTASTPTDSTNTENEQGLVLSSGESADVSIAGFLPDSDVQVVIYSEPRNLGLLQVNEFGELVASIQIPNDMEAGSHTLVLTGLDKFGKNIELKFGLVIYSSDSYIPIWVWFLVGLLLILLAASLVSQKNKKVIIAT